MTWSIIAIDSASGQIGIAVATRFFAVGSRVPHIATGFGAVATQALVNPYYGIDGARLLRQGKSPDDDITTLLAGKAVAAGRRMVSRTGIWVISSPTR